LKRREGVFCSSVPDFHIGNPWRGGLNLELRNSGTELTGRFQSENRGELRESGNELEKEEACFLFPLS
jgi:hypothetical protein